MTQRDANVVQNVHYDLGLTAPEEDEQSSPAVYWPLDRRPQPA